MCPAPGGLLLHQLFGGSAFPTRGSNGANQRIRSWHSVGRTARLVTVERRKVLMRSLHNEQICQSLSSALAPCMEASPYPKQTEDCTSLVLSPTLQASLSDCRELPCRSAPALASFRYYAKTLPAAHAAHRRHSSLTKVSCNNIRSVTPETLAIKTFCTALLGIKTFCTTLWGTESHIRLRLS